MIIHHPGDRYTTLKLFGCFVDFLIHQINQDKLEVGKRLGSLNRHRGFEILLVKSKEISKEINIVLEHSQMRGFSIVTPIEGFQFILCQGCIVQADLISQSPNEYDKMLELFKAGLGYLQRHDQNHYDRILKAVNLPSLERQNWKRSTKALEREVAENFDIRMATQNFQRMKEQTLANLISKYKGQGYEIDEEES